MEELSVELKILSCERMCVCVNERERECERDREREREGHKFLMQSILFSLSKFVHLSRRCFTDVRFPFSESRKVARQLPDCERVTERERE